MERFYQKTASFYCYFKIVGVKLDIDEVMNKPVDPKFESFEQLEADHVLVREDLGFRTFTKPKCAATGLRYAHLVWRFVGLCQEEDLAKEPMLKFIQHLVQTRAGSRTCQGALYALVHFSKVLGFPAYAGSWHRCKLMADAYQAELKTEPSRAAALSKRFFTWLEAVVLDETRSLPDRAAATRLRIATGASARHSDILRTPIARCEWIFVPGTDNLEAQKC